MSGATLVERQKALLRDLRELGFGERISRNAVDLLPQSSLEGLLEWCAPERATELQNCLDTLQDLGFMRAEALEAVLAVGTEPEKAADWVLNRPKKVVEPEIPKKRLLFEEKIFPEELPDPTSEEVHLRVMEALKSLFSIPSSNPDIPALHEIPKKQRTFEQRLQNLMDRRDVLRYAAQSALLWGCFRSGHPEYVLIREGLMKLLLDLDGLDLPRVWDPAEEVWIMDPEWRLRRKGWIREADALADKVQKCWAAQLSRRKAEEQQQQQEEEKR